MSTLGVNHSQKGAVLRNGRANTITVATDIGLEFNHHQPQSDAAGRVLLGDESRKRSHGEKVIESTGGEIATVSNVP